MVEKPTDYWTLVREIEEPLRSCAKHSFEDFGRAQTVLDGGEIRDYYDGEASKSPHRIDQRTPLQRE